MSDRNESVEVLARVLHDEVGGCCVSRFDACVFGGSGVRDEAERFLASPDIGDALAAVWEEGYYVGLDVTHDGPPPNPYREEAS